MIPSRYRHALWGEHRCRRELVRFLNGSGNEPGLDAAIAAMDRLNCWPACIAALTRDRRPDTEAGLRLLSFWRARGLWSIPRGLKNDLPLFADALRYHLPAYTGPEVILYRGQNKERHLAGVYGIAWTTDVVYAGIFSRLRDTEGVVVRTVATPPMIVADAPTYDGYLKEGEEEYIIDPRLIQSLDVVPPSEIPDEIRH